MVASESTVYFDRLPPKTRMAVKEILEHRKEMLEVGKKVAVLESLVIIPASIVGGMATRRAGVGIGVAAAGLAESGAIGKWLMGTHSSAFRKEYIRLYTALRAEKEHPAIKKLVEKNPFLVVNANGMLVGKKTMPKIFGLPLGRRRVASPHAKTAQKKEWATKYLPKRGPRKLKG